MAGFGLTKDFNKMHPKLFKEEPGRKTIEDGLRSLEKIDHSFDQAIQGRLEQFRDDQDGLDNFGSTRLDRLDDEQIAAGREILGFDPRLLDDPEANIDQICKEYAASLPEPSDGIDEHFEVPETVNDKEGRRRKRLAQLTRKMRNGGTLTDKEEDEFYRLYEAHSDE